MLLFMICIVSLYYLFSFLKWAGKLKWEKIKQKILLCGIMIILVFWQKRKHLIKKPIIKDEKTGWNRGVARTHTRRKWYDPTFTTILQHRWFYDYVSRGIKKKYPNQIRIFLQRLMRGNREEYYMIKNQLFYVPVHIKNKLLNVKKKLLLQKTRRRRHLVKRTWMGHQFSCTSIRLIRPVCKMYNIKKFKEINFLYRLYGFVVKKKKKKRKKKTESFSGLKDVKPNMPTSIDLNSKGALDQTPVNNGIPSVVVEEVLPVKVDMNGFVGKKKNKTRKKKTESSSGLKDVKPNMPTSTDLNSKGALDQTSVNNGIPPVVVEEVLPVKVDMTGFDLDRQSFVVQIDELLKSEEMQIQGLKKQTTYYNSVHRALLKMSFGPLETSKYLRQIEPYFFSLDTLKKAGQPSFDEQMLQIFQFAQLEQSLLFRWKKLAADTEIEILSHTRSDPAAEYWNLKLLDQCLRPRLSLLKNSNYIDPDFVIQWFRNYDEATILIRNQDLTYMEVLQWFEQYPWLIRGHRHVPVNPSAVFPQFFFDINYKEYRISDKMDVDVLRNLIKKVLKSSVYRYLRRAVFGLFYKWNFGMLLNLSLRGFNALVRNIWVGCRSALLTCLIAYPDIRTASINTIWNRVFEYVCAEFVRNVQILKAALNNIRIVYLVGTLKTITNQMKFGWFLQDEKIDFIWKWRDYKKQLSFKKFQRQSCGLVPVLKFEQQKLLGLLPLLRPLQYLKYYKKKFGIGKKKRQGSVLFKKILSRYNSWKASLASWRDALRRRKEVELRQQKREKKKREWMRRLSRKRSTTRFYRSFFLWSFQFLQKNRLKRKKRVQFYKEFIKRANLKFKNRSFQTDYLFSKISTLKFYRRWHKVLKKIKPFDLKKTAMPQLLQEKFLPLIQPGRKTYRFIPKRRITFLFCKRAREKRKGVFNKIMQSSHFFEQQALISGWWWSKIAWDLLPLVYFNRNWYGFETSQLAYNQVYFLNKFVVPAIRVAKRKLLLRNYRRIFKLADSCSKTSQLAIDWQYKTNKKNLMNFWVKKNTVLYFWYEQKLSWLNHKKLRVSIKKQNSFMRRVLLWNSRFKLLKFRRFFTRLYEFGLKKRRYWQKTGKKPWRRRRRIFKRARFRKTRIHWSRFKIKKVFTNIKKIYGRKTGVRVNKIRSLHYWLKAQIQPSTLLHCASYRLFMQSFAGLFQVAQSWKKMPYFIRVLWLSQIFPTGRLFGNNLKYLVLTLKQGVGDAPILKIPVGGLLFDTFLLPHKKKRYKRWLKNLLKGRFSRPIVNHFFRSLQYWDFFFTTQFLGTRVSRQVLQNNVQTLQGKPTESQRWRRVKKQKKKRILVVQSSGTFFVKTKQNTIMARPWLEFVNYARQERLMEIYRFFKQVTLKTIYSYMPNFDFLYVSNFALFNFFNLYLGGVTKQQYFQKTNIIYSKVEYYKGQKKRLWQYLILLKIFYNEYYNNKKSKNLPNHYALSLIYQFFFITAQKNKVLFLNQRRDRRFRVLNLGLKSKFKNRKMRHSVRYKRGLYKLKILFDRLFIWLYNENRVRYVFGERIKAMYVPFLQIDVNLLYRRSKKFFIR